MLQTLLKYINIFLQYGILYNDKIYTYRYTINTNITGYDIVKLTEIEKELYITGLLHHDIIPIYHVPPFHKLAHIIDGEEKKITYYPGTPFKIHHGTLQLKKMVRRGIGYTTVVVAEGSRWPIR